MQFVKGQIGAIIIIIAIMGSVLGGFMLNASNVTGCTTNYKYVTDVAGAFSGTGADMEVEYNPLENVTGYTVYDPITGGGSLDLAHGIRYVSSSSGATGYWVQVWNGGPTIDALTLQSFGPTTWGENPKGQATVTVNDSYTSGKVNQVTGAGVDHFIINPVSFPNQYTTTYFSIDGVTHTGANIVTLQEIFDRYKASGVSFGDATQLVLTISDSITNDYPTFIGKYSSERKPVDLLNFGFYFSYQQSAHQVVITGLDTGKYTAILGEQSYDSLSDVAFVWDGSYGHISASYGGLPLTDYIDNTKGVIPVKMDMENVWVQYMSTEYSTLAKCTATFNANIAYLSGYITYTYLDENLVPHANNWAAYEFTRYSGSDKEAWTIAIHFFDTAGQVIKDAEINIPYSDFSIQSCSNPLIKLDLTMGLLDRSSVHSTLWAIQLDLYDANDTSNINHQYFGKTTPLPTLELQSFAFTGYQSDEGSMGNYSLTLSYAVNGQGYVVSTTSDPTLTSPLCKSEYHVEQQTYHTTETYWYNGYQNSAMTLVFPKTDFNGNIISGLDTFKVIWNTEGGYLYSDVQLDYSDNHWHVKGIDIGDWAAISVRIYKDISGTPYLGVTPIQSFTSFLDYTPITASEIPIELKVTTEKGAVVTNYSLTSIQMLKWDTKNVDGVPQTVHRHEVVDTIVFLPSGGMYTQDGVFEEKQSFPNDTMVKLRIMSAVHVGDGITIKNSAGETVSFKTDRVSKWVDSVGNTCDFADLSIIYVDSSVPAVVIDGKTYKGGMYYTNPDGSETFIEKGYLYYQFGTKGVITKVGEKESTNDWSVTLNGVWAMSTSYSTGENVSSSHVEWDGLSGIWAWTNTDTVLVFSGICILMLVLCAWRYQLSGLDWAIGLCGVIVPFFMWAI